ncbi:hypothetical protein B4U79_19227, partial [Dinothrombium tinctorium]
TSYVLSFFFKNIWLLYLSLVIFGIFCNASSVIAIDFLLEVSFPFPENLCYAIAASSYALPNLIFVPLATILCEKVGALYANFVLLSFGIITLSTALLAKEDLRRRRANAEINEEIMPLLQNQ